MKNLAGTHVLVTGADGFIGSHLVERLVEEGAVVRAFCQYNSIGSTGWLAHCAPEVRAGFEPVLGDIRDSGQVRELLDGIDTVFHLAALIAIPYSYIAPRSFVETNVLGTLNVLEAARAHETPFVINTSTSEVYGTPESVPIAVTHPLRAQSPYAATKIAADELCLSYAASFGVNVSILRPFNTYGPRQSLRAVIPTVLSQMISGAKEIRLGSLHPKRDFTFVKDTVDGFVRMSQSDRQGGEVVQLGTGTAVSIAQLVDVCREITGSDAMIVTEDERVRPERSEVQVLLSDPSGALTAFGWAPSTSLREGLEATAQWLASAPGPADSAKYAR